MTYRYLIIDDEPLIRKGIIKKLSSMEHMIECCGEATDGRQGIAMIGTTQPDFLIIDMKMPLMDGMELLPYLNKHYPDMPVIVVSGHSNFEYMKQAISSKVRDYILKPFSKEEIQKSVLSLINCLEKDQFDYDERESVKTQNELSCYYLDISMVENLIKGYDTDTIEIRSQKLDFIRYNQYGYILLCVYFVQSPSEHLQQKSFLLETPEGKSLYILSGSRKELGFILWSPNVKSGLQKNAVERYTDEFRLRSVPGSDCFYIAASSAFIDLSDLHTACLETMTALDARLVINDQSSCLFYSNHLLPIQIIWDREIEFLFRVESGNLTETERLMNNLFHVFTQTKGCTLADAKLYCEYLSAQCSIFHNVTQHKEDRTRSVSNQKMLASTLFSLPSIKQYYTQYFLDVAASLNEKGYYSQGTVIEQVMTYIQRNYQNNINQDIIASFFYLNRSYLSHLFKKKTGKKFVDYLNEVRIEKAKELLICTERPVYKIARYVGYENTKYFFKVFKSKTGTSPESYRKK